MNLKEKIFKKYDAFSVLDNTTEKNIIRAEIKTMIAQLPEIDSSCYHLLGILDYESNDWKENIEFCIKNFKKAIDLDEDNFLAQLYLAHCYHDLNKLRIALEHYKKVNQDRLKKFQVWRYIKLLEQIGFCEYKLGNISMGEQYFEKVLEQYKEQTEIDRIPPLELMSCLPKEH